MDEKSKKTRRWGRYGEKTALRRVPVSVLPLLDFLLERMAEAAKNDPRRTLERVGRAVDQITAEEQSRADKAQERALSTLNRYSR